MNDHYTTYRQLDHEHQTLVRACTHEPKRMGFSFIDGTAECCMPCARANRELAGMVRDAYKAARKRQLADMPRCEFCHRRGTVKAGAGEPALVCGRHFKKAQRQKDRLGTLGLFVTYTGDDVRAILAD